MRFSFVNPAWLSGLTLLGAVAGCSTKKADDQTAATPAAIAAAADTTAAAPAAPARLQVPDSANLSPKFLKGLRDLTGTDTYKVRGQWLVLDAQDSVAFPTELPLGRAITYTGHQGRQTLTLTVTRLNYTSLRFAAELAGGSGPAQRAEGLADLNPGFYLAAELPEDSESQTAFAATEFAGETAQGNFSLQIGQGADADKAALFAYDATGKPLAKWQNAPTLRRLAL